MMIIERVRNVRGKTRYAIAIVLLCGLLAGGFGVSLSLGQDKGKRRVIGEVTLPLPQTKGKMSLEEALSLRRSIRKFTAERLTIAEVGQLMWAAQGITDKARGFRTAPSAGATYPLEVYLVMPDGFFHYVPTTHRLERLGNEDLRLALGGVSSTQDYVRDAPLDIVLTGIVARTAGKYGDRAARYMHFEAGHAAQNVLLQATALGLGAVVVGGVADESIQKILALPADEVPLYIVPVGHPEKK